MKSYTVILNEDDREIIEGIVKNYNCESLLSSTEDATLYVVLSQIVEQDGFIE
jgi:hypothetical protein